MPDRDVPAGATDRTVVGTRQHLGQFEPPIPTRLHVADNDEAVGPDDRQDGRAVDVAEEMLEAPPRTRRRHVRRFQRQAEVSGRVSDPLPFEARGVPHGVVKKLKGSHRGPLVAEAPD